VEGETEVSTNPISFRLPFESQMAKLPPEHQHIIRTTWNAITDLQGAIPLLKSQIEGNKTAITTATTNTTTASETIIQVASTYGTVNNQSGVTSYTTLQSDSGAFVILSDASPIAVILSSIGSSPGIQLPWSANFLNLGAGTATLTTSSGTISYSGNIGAASLVLPQYFAAWVAFDGSNYWAVLVPIGPQNTPAIAHEWLNSYDSDSGIFAQTRPDYSDLTGLPQLPNDIVPVAGEYLTGYDATSGNFSSSTPAGVSGTITLAALTGGGTQGSITVTGGIITAFTNPT
jgi:hypothetical protein